MHTATAESFRHLPTGFRNGDLRPLVAASPTAVSLSPSRWLVDSLSTPSLGPAPPCAAPIVQRDDRRPTQSPRRRFPAGACNSSGVEAARHQGELARGGLRYLAQFEFHQKDCDVFYNANESALDPDDTEYAKYLTGSAGNLVGLSDPQIDKDLEQGPRGGGPPATQTAVCRLSAAASIRGPGNCAALHATAGAASLAAVPTFGFLAVRRTAGRAASTSAVATERAVCAALGLWSIHAEMAAPS
jgi:hypothetical protein